MDRLQAQLKELIFLPHDLQLLPESVVAAIQEYQRYGGRRWWDSGAFFPHLMPSPGGGLAFSRNLVTRN